MLFHAILSFLFAQKPCQLLLLACLGLVCGSWCQPLNAQTPAAERETVPTESPQATQIKLPMDSASDLPPVPTGMQVEFAAAPTKLLAESGFGDWETIDFAGGGESSVAGSTLKIGSGETLTGIYWDGASLPVNNYELSMQARRTEGIDFFCGPVFPVNDSHCCLIVGGWAGATVGLSSIDDKDASQNETTKLLSFEDNRWYDIRIRVLPDRIIAWIDNDCVIYQNIVGKRISLRGDTDLCTPMGFCTFQTKAEIRKLTLQRIGKPSKTKPASNPPTK